MEHEIHVRCFFCFKQHSSVFSPLHFLMYTGHLHVVWFIVVLMANLTSGQGTTVENESFCWYISWCWSMCIVPEIQFSYIKYVTLRTQTIVCSCFLDHRWITDILLLPPCALTETNTDDSQLALSNYIYCQLKSAKCLKKSLIKCTNIFP